MSPARIAVVGGGPTGLSAAAVAAGAGAAVTLFDERDDLGGQLCYRAQAVVTEAGSPAIRPDEARTSLIAAAASAGAELRPGSLVTAAFSSRELLVLDAERVQRVRADAVVVATGSTDLPFPFAGSTLPGVFSARGLQILLNQWRVRPGKRFAIIGESEAADELAVDVLLAGGEVVWSGIAPGPFLAAEGEGGVEVLRVGNETHTVDVIAIAVGRQPDPALATAAGNPLAFAAALGGLAPVLDGRLASPVDRFFVAGDAAGVGSVATAVAEGRLAGISAAASLELASEDDVLQAIERGGEELAWRVAQREGASEHFTPPYRSGVSR